LGLQKLYSGLRFADLHLRSTAINGLVVTRAVTAIAELCWFRAKFLFVSHVTGNPVYICKQCIFDDGNNLTILMQERKYCL